MKFRHFCTLIAFVVTVYGADSKKSSPPIKTQPSSRRIVVGATDVVPVLSKVGFSTMVILPPTEEIIEATCGDKENWIVNGLQNLAHIKPVHEGSRSNLNLLTKSGNVYSFLLTEISPSGLEPDLKLFVEPKEDFQTKRPVRFVSAEELDTARKEAGNAQRNAVEAEQRAKENSEQQIRRFRVEYPLRLQFYTIHGKLSQSPFNIRAIFSDGTFTYIKTTSTEIPTVYERVLSRYLPIAFEKRGDTLVISKVIKFGRVGSDKSSLEFYF